MTIANYGAGVWGFQEANDPQVLQNRVCRYYLGVRKFTPVAATRIIMDWPDMKSLRWVEVLRYRNRLTEMDVQRLPVKLYKLEKSLKIKGWVQNVKSILQYCNMLECFPLEVRCDLEVAHARLHKLNRDRWWVEASTMTKLENFVQVYEKGNPQYLVKSSLSRSHRSLLAKTLCGVAPLMVELGRFKNIPREKRVCRICTKNVTETEEHFLMECESLNTTRDKHKAIIGGLDMLTLFKKDNLKLTASMLEEMFHERHLLMTKKAK